MFRFNNKSVKDILKILKQEQVIIPEKTIRRILKENIKNNFNNKTFVSIPEDVCNELFGSIGEEANVHVNANVNIKEEIQNNKEGIKEDTKEDNKSVEEFKID